MFLRKNNRDDGKLGYVLKYHIKQSALSARLFFHVSSYCTSVKNRTQECMTIYNKCNRIIRFWGHYCPTLRELVSASF